MRFYLTSFLIKSRFVSFPYWFITVIDISITISVILTIILSVVKTLIMTIITVSNIIFRFPDLLILEPLIFIVFFSILCWFAIISYFHCSYNNRYYYCFIIIFMNFLILCFISLFSFFPFSNYINWIWFSARFTWFSLSNPSLRCSLE